MSKKFRLPILILLSVGAVLAAALLLLRGNNFAVLDPKGPIAQEQFNLIIFTSLLSLIVVVPVFVLTFYIVWKYRAGRVDNKKAAYSPEWDHSRTAETIWWLVPLMLIAVLAVITWITTHKLDPYRPIVSDKKPITVQVVALQWKWLFIYPEQKIASVNYLQFPKDTPINFEITADAPMNSFWIPQLGGQVYAMAGMQTKLHLQAAEIGEFKGSSANISGEGFAGMKFSAWATSQQEFDEWVESTRQAPYALTMSEYDALAKPSENNPPSFYTSPDAKLYDTVMMKYMTPGMQNMQ
ncbi:MAG: ubiquinol oxidase subunit II, partial [Candidatus Saccharimonadales bacterium]